MQSPIFIPTTINCLFENIDAIDVAATSISCTNLTVDGEPISTLVQNVDSVSDGSTSFTGSLQSDSLVVSGSVSCGSIATSGPILQVTNGSLAVLKTLSATSITTSGDITQTTGTTSLKALTATSITTSGDITQTTGTTSLQELTVEGNITQTTGTTSLQALTATSVTTSGNITQSAGTTSLAALTCTGAIATSTNLQLSFIRNPIAGELGYKNSGIFSTIPTIVSGLNTIAPLASITISDPGTYQFHAAIAISKTGTSLTVNRLELSTSSSSTSNMINVAQIGNQALDSNLTYAKVEVTHTETILTVPVQRYCGTAFYLSSNAASISTDARNLYFYALKIA